MKPTKKIVLPIPIDIGTRNSTITRSAASFALRAASTRTRRRYRRPSSSLN